MTYFSLIICGALLVGIAIPLGIYVLTRKRTGVAEFDVFSQVIRKSRDAWRRDEDLMQELSQAISVLSPIQENEKPRATLENEEQKIPDD